MRLEPPTETAGIEAHFAGQFPVGTRTQPPGDLSQTILVSVPRHSREITCCRCQFELPDPREPRPCSRVEPAALSHAEVDQSRFRFTVHHAERYPSHLIGCKHRGRTKKCRDAGTIRMGAPASRIVAELAVLTPPDEDSGTGNLNPYSAPQPGQNHPVFPRKHAAIPARPPALGHATIALSLSLAGRCSPP